MVKFGVGIDADPGEGRAISMATSKVLVPATSILNECRADELERGAKVLPGVERVVDGPQETLGLPIVQKTLFPGLQQVVSWRRVKGGNLDDHFPAILSRASGDVIVRQMEVD
jgi:hypothetical protein